MQDFDFCPNRIKFYPNFVQVCLKKFARGNGRIPSFYTTGIRECVKIKPTSYNKILSLSIVERMTAEFQRH